MQIVAESEFTLPPAIADLLAARNKLRAHYHAVGLNFTLDGNLVGDIGEAVANDLFGVDLGPRCGPGIDGVAPNGRTVQVKASGTGRGAVFRKVETEADHLLFFSFNFEACKGVVAYNGPERIVREFLPRMWAGQLPISLAKLRRANATVVEADRLPFIRCQEARL